VECSKRANKHGEGKYTYSNGETYNGTFENDNRHGYGELHYSDGRFYKGNFVNDKQHGKALYQDSHRVIGPSYWNYGVLEENHYGSH
jgi:hypothetical protein